MPTALKIAAVVEPVSLLLLLLNLATVHVAGLAELVGPLHGAAYLVVIATTLLSEGATGRAKLAALVPGVGGLLAIRSMPGSRQAGPAEE
jgi:hypothetical protein